MSTDKGNKSTRNDLDAFVCKPDPKHFNHDDTLKRLFQYQGSPTKQNILDLILPSKESAYSLSEVEDTLSRLDDQMEAIQREANDEFDRMLPEDVQLRLGHLTANLQQTQQQVLRLQCNICQTRDQHHEVRRLCSDKVMQTRRDIIQAENNLKVSLQESKFKQVLEFFQHFVIHLDAAISSTLLQITRLAGKSIPSFDWPTYHQTIFLLRACGKALIDVDRFERLYKNTGFFEDLKAISFKIPLGQLDLNKFIELPEIYSLENQLDITKQLQPSGHEVKIDFNQFLSDAKVSQCLSMAEDSTNSAYSIHRDRLSAITKDCCRLIIDLNLNYIEALFTRGINIDKLNGCDTSHCMSAPSLSIPSGDTEPLPSYAFSPQEYITHIGQHVLTLRKQTEQFDQDKKSLMVALDYLRYVEQDDFEASVFKSVTEVVLNCIARHCIKSLIGRTTKSVLSQLTQNGRRQLATDAMYLDNVLEDLGLLDQADESVKKFKLLFDFQ